MRFPEIEDAFRKANPSLPNEVIGYMSEIYAISTMPVLAYVELRIAGFLSDHWIKLITDQFPNKVLNLDEKEKAYQLRKAEIDKRKTDQERNNK